jgi:hypothetical protein
MSNPEDTPVDLVKPPADRRSRDCLCRVAELEKLLGRDDPMLALGKRGNSMVSSWFVTHIETKGEVTLVLPPDCLKPFGLSRTLRRSMGNICSGA